MPSRKHNDEQAHRYFEDGVHVTAATTIQRPAADLYAVWRQLQDLPRFIDHLASVEPFEGTKSRWTTRGPGNRLYTWEAEIIRDEPDRIIAWKTLPGAEIPNAGTVRFRELPFDRGTEVHVALEYIPKGGKVGDAVAKVMGDDARTQVREALHRFRQVMETGEIPTSKGQPAGKSARRHDRPGESDKRMTDANVRDIADTHAGPAQGGPVPPAARPGAFQGDHR